ncbi:carbon storage regulator [Pseudomonas amygdali pv. morsprunorum]|uniref:carbon storage regulator n=1 Tax=Pseudomonas amygdali TaxID=47877 RepID=UPI000CDA0CDC|nr:carbon storage regulator [Pseudomonas amygdali]POP75155.1 carbon storage regulator [Pseudomonas amygdali pv. morsprunorum]
MLLLTRREGEAIVIADEIKVQVISVSQHAGSVRIKIEAPDAVPVHSAGVESDAPACKAGPVIRHKRRRRALVTSDKCEDT